MQIRSVEELEALLGPSSEAVADIRRLFDLAEGYGFKEWLVFDPSVVRGLAYYTGVGVRMYVCVQVPQIRLFVTWDVACNKEHTHTNIIETQDTIVRVSSPGCPSPGWVTGVGHIIAALM